MPLYSVKSTLMESRSRLELHGHASVNYLCEIMVSYEHLTF